MDPRKAVGRKLLGKWWWLTLLGAVVLIAGTSWWIVGNNKSTDAQSGLAILSLPQALQGMKTDIPHTYAYMNISTQADQTNTLGYHVASYNFDVLLPFDSATAFSVLDSHTTNEQSTYSELTEAIGIVQNYFGRAGYTQDNADSTTGYLSANSFYARGDSICQITIYTKLDVTCGSKTALQSMAKQTAQPVSLYQAAAPTGLGTPTVGSLTTQSSKVRGYSIATLPIYNSAGTTVAYYYRTSGAWNMVNLNWYNDPTQSGTIVPNCADFESNSAVAAAFTGQTCYNSATRAASTIQ